MPINQRGLHNVRFAVKDAQTFLQRYVAPSSINEFQLYHPQPYHDLRKAHLRVLTPQRRAGVHSALRPGGLLVVQTDNPDYWAYMTRVLPSFLDLSVDPDSWPDAPEGRTRRKILAREQGLTIVRGTGNRGDDLGPGAVAALAQTLPQQ